MITSVYIHIPFCKKICSYCDFPKFCYQKKWIMPYLDSLKEEIKKEYKGDLIKTLYIGGGTPTSLDLEELEYLLNITKVFHQDENIEFTVEANLSDLTLPKIKLLKRYGVNRISIGIQTLNKSLQDILNRNEEKETLKNTISHLKEEGISNLNIDLMYAIPSETLKDVEEDLSFFLSLDIPHISTYSLILEEHTALFLKHLPPISEELDEKMYKLICKTLKDHGYKHYEVSNFAKKGYESNHNLTYWNNEVYYGFGLGASGYVHKKRYTNHQNLMKYMKKDYSKEIETLDNTMLMEYEMILGLRKEEGVSQDLFYQKYGKKIDEIFDIDDLLKKGLLVWNHRNLMIPENKIYLSNEILVNFILH